jgi:uncharacterized protein (TIGR02246 family)
MSEPPHNNLPGDSMASFQTSSDDEIRQRYFELLRSWKEQDAKRFASLFADDGSLVGFDGTAVNGKTNITEHLSQIFADHRTAEYVTVIREVRWLAKSIALLRAAVGMIPPGMTELNPAANAIQSVVFIQEDKSWKIALFHNTPAAFHGRPEEVEQLTQELRYKGQH